MISRQRWMLGCALLGLIAVMGAQLGAAEAPPHTCTHDVVYGRKAGLALTMDVFQPKKANGAVLLWIRGGWPERPFAPEVIFTFLDRGYTVFAVCHGSIPVFRLDEIVPDIHRAVRYVRHHSREYKVDPERLAILGMSFFNGLLAAHVGVSGGEGPPFPKPDLAGIGRFDPIEVEESSKVAAFVSICGPADLLNYEAEGKSILEFRYPLIPRVKELVVKLNDEDKARVEHFTAPFEFRDFNRKTGLFARVTDVEDFRRRLKALSPVSLVSAKSAPGLLIHGDKDENVPVRQAEVLAGRLREAGVDVDLVIRKGAGHYVYHWPEDNKIVADWLDKRLNPRKSDRK